MAVVAAVRIVNIISVTQGTIVEEGVRSVTITADKGRLLPILKEADLYPTASENVGTADFPVTTQIAFEQSAVNMLALLAESVGTLVIIVKKAGGAGNVTITITGHQFRRLGVPQSLQGFGRPTIDGVAYSANGTTLPISAT